MTRDDFVKKWKPLLAGIALCGLVSELRDAPMQRGAKALDIPADVERWLSALYSDATGQPPISLTPQPVKKLAEPLPSHEDSPLHRNGLARRDVNGHKPAGGPA